MSIKIQTDVKTEKIMLGIVSGISKHDYEKKTSEFNGCPSDAPNNYNSCGRENIFPFFIR